MGLSHELAELPCSIILASSRHWSVDQAGTERLVQRYGYRGRDWETRAGTVELRISKLRKGPYFPAFLEPRRMAEKASPRSCRRPTSRVSTRSVDDLIEAMGMDR